MFAADGYRTISAGASAPTRTEKKKLHTNHRGDSVTQILVVANKTLGSRNLADTLDARLTAHSERSVNFLVLLDPRPIWAVGDPTNGAVWLGDIGFDWDREVREQAAERLRPLQQRLHLAGATVTAQMTGGDPVREIGTALMMNPTDEIIISTLPYGLSHWLRLDLPHRIRKEYSVPVSTVVEDMRHRRGGNTRTTI